MKKYPVIALAALAGMFFASCDEYTLPNPPAQSNPEEVVFNASDLALTSVVNGTVDLAKLQSEGLPIDLFNVSLKDFPASYRLQLVAEVAATEEFKETEAIKLGINDNNVATMPVSDMQAAFRNIVSKAPEARTVYMRVPAYAVNGTSSVRLGGSDYYYFTGNMVVNPVPGATVIETGYYLVGSFCDWNIAKAIPFSQVNEGNPYDNPEFRVKIDVTAAQAEGDGYRWKVVPVSGFNNTSWAGALGSVAGDSNMSGSLIESAEAETNAGVITQEGPYIITINLETMKFKVEAAFDYLWVPGMGSSTKDFDKIMRLSCPSGDYMNYEGTMSLLNFFWFTGQASVNGVNYRPDGDDNEADENGVLSGKMIYDVTSTKTMKVLPVGKYGLFYIKANVVTLEWSATPIPVINMVGSFNGWNQKEAPAMTPNAQFTVWKGTITFAEPGEFKFCVNNDWKYSYGTADGTFNSVQQNAGNYKVEEAGTYDVTLTFNKFPNTVTIVKK